MSSPPPRPQGTPDDVRIEWEARRPTTDPTLGIKVTTRPHHEPAALNRLVTVGDSLTQGFQSLAISKTDLSWPAQVARGTRAVRRGVQVPHLSGLRRPAAQPGAGGPWPSGEVP